MIFVQRIIIPVVLLLTLVGCRQKSHAYIDKGIWVSLRDGETIDGYTRLNDNIYGGYADSIYMQTHMKALSGIDMKTFKVCKGTGYAKDIHHVYYPLKIRCEDASEYGGCYFVEYIIDDAISATFKYIGHGYATDGEKLYDEGREVDWSVLKDDSARSK